MSLSSPKRRAERERIRERGNKVKREIVAMTFVLLLFLMMFSSLPLVSAIYTVEEHYMPSEPDDLEPVCAMKTRTDGWFYVPNVAADLLKIEMLFDDQDVVGDLTGGTSPYGGISYPDGIVNIYDVTTVTGHFGISEGDSNWYYMADIKPDRCIDIFDVTCVASNFGKTGTYTTDLSGVTVTFDTGGEISPDSYDFVTIPQDATSFTVKRNGTPTGAMAIFYEPREPPVAYSTTFDFTVPAYTGGDVGKEVWYYILARLYVPSELSGQIFCFVATADCCVQNVKINGYSKTGSGSSVNVDLGELGGGYHLLEFEFVDVSGGGSLNFHVATAASQYAWLSRFRVYVPNYSETEYRYTVKTQTYFPISDYYFVGGYADDFIDDIKLGGGLIWQDWQWDMGPQYGSIHAWGDGFLYPLGYLDPAAWRNIEFTFGEIWLGGLLDFQMISWTHQKDTIGPPKFRAIGNLNQADHITINNAMFYGGSSWKSEADPEFSERFYEARQIIDASYDDGSTWFNASIEVGLGLGWAEWALLPATEDDVGITLNFTATEFLTNRRDHMDMGFWFELHFDDPTIDIYSFPALEIAGVEYQEHDSFVNSDLTSAIDYTGTVVMFVSGALLPSGPPAILGAGVGLGIKGLAAVLKITQGQYVSRFEPIITETNNYQVLRHYDLSVGSPSEGETKTKSDILFFKLNPAAGKHCGLTKVVLRGTLTAVQWFIGGPGTGPFPIWGANIANITTTIDIPWFLRG